MLRQQVIKGIKWTSIAAIAGAGLQLLQVAVLTRFLNPADFGLMALALFVIGFSQLFMDMGISNGIIYKQEISENQLNSLYWLNIISGWIIFGLIFLIAPFASAFYHEPELKKILILTGVTFLIQPFEQQFYALMKKELLFNEIAKRDILSKLVSFIIAVVLAYKGYGVYSLVFAYIGSVLTSTLLLVSIGLKYHKPRFYLNLKEIRFFLRFGMFQMGEFIGSYINTNIDTLLIGKLLGVEALGIYNIAKNLSMRPIQVISPIITQVTFPALSRIQHDTEKLKDVYLKTLRYLTSVNFPVYIFLCVFAHPVVLLMFGNKWLQVVPILQILSLYCMARSINNPVGALLLAKGRVEIGFYVNLVLLFLIPACIYIGSLYGLTGVSVMLLTLQVLYSIVLWKLLTVKIFKISFYEYFHHIFTSMLLTTSAVLIVSWIVSSDISALIKIIAGGMAFLITYLVLNYLFNKKLLTEVLSLVKTAI